MTLTAIMVDELRLFWITQKRACATGGFPAVGDWRREDMFISRRGFGQFAPTNLL